MCTALSSFECTKTHLAHAAAEVVFDLGSWQLARLGTPGDVQTLASEHRELADRRARARELVVHVNHDLQHNSRS